MEYRYRHDAPDSEDNRQPYEFLPSVSLAYKVSDKINITLYYRRTTSYPTMGQLNPIQNYENKYQYYVGNPELKPVVNNTLNYRLPLPANFSWNMGYFRSHNMIQ